LTPESTSQGWALVLEDRIDRKEHAIGRRAVDGKATPPELADAQRVMEGERMAGAALLLLRRHDPDIRAERPCGLFQDLDPAGIDAVVVADEDARLGEIDGPVKHRGQ
jgi:hypothetical protein